MHEGSVDEHQAGKSQGDGRIFGRDLDGDDAYNDDEAVGDVEVFPACGQVQDLLRPGSPVEDKFF